MSTAHLLQQENGDTLVLIFNDEGMVTNTFSHLGEFQGVTVSIQEDSVRISRTEMQPVQTHEDIPITEGLPAPVGDEV